MLDIFNSDAFSVLRLTTALNDVEFAPGRLGAMGLFNEQRIDTTFAAFEKKGDSLVLVPPSQRGGPGTTATKDKRNLRNLAVPHFEINDAIYAESVQNVRSFGSTSTLETVVEKVMNQQAKHVRSLGVTEEHARVGAIKGIVTYADGSTLDLFSEFGVSQIAEIDFDLDNANPAEGALMKKCNDIGRKIANELGGIPFTGIHAMVGDTFFDQLLTHPEVRETYKNTTQAEFLRQSQITLGGSSFGMFEFGGIVWENYRGATGGTAFVEATKAHIFPVGAPDLFQTIYSPADYEETVNTIAERLYARQYPMQNGKGRHLDVQMNALQVCSRPRTLLKAKNT